MSEADTKLDPRDASLGDLFARQVALRPDAPAVTYGPTSLTYRQLDRVTNSVAARLRELGAGPDASVAVLADRSLSVVVAMLATAKAGGAYLALDPSHPPARLRVILAESKPVALLSEEELEDPSGLGIPVVTVIEYLKDSVRDDEAHDTRVDGGAGPEDLAYIVYTSGSSGTPKGICVTHRNVVRRTKDVDYLTFEPGDRVGQISNAAFDAATIEVWGALLNGGELIGFDRDTILSPGRLGATLRERRIDTIVIATPLFNQLAADDPTTFATVSQVLVGGDVMAVRQADAVAALPGCTLLNGYGPAECTTLATAHRVTRMPQDQLKVPIGRPIAHTSCYVLDDALQPVPPGIPGQLFVGGDGVARGYLERPELTRERFLPDPFAGDGGRMYATGDLVRELPDGSLDFVGRADFQVKIRGFRVETTEIDATLLQHPLVGEAVTIAEADPETGDKTLIGYFVAAADASPEPAELTGFLRERLPEYMVPRLIRLPELPKNANMKIDRARLASTATAPSPADDAASAESSAAEPLEDQVAGIIGELLNVPSFGVIENFFEGGGQSILAIRLLTQVGRRFGVTMTLAEFFEDPTARGVADHVRRGTA